MRIALDATYSVDPHPSGIAVYSRALLSGLARIYPADEFFHCYRLKQLRHTRRDPSPNVHRKLLLPPLPLFRTEIFHALNQRVDRRPAKKVISTFHDLFVMTDEYSSAEFRTRFTRQARLAAQNSDYIIAVSQFTANQVTSLLGFDPERVRVVPHGVSEPSQESAVREKTILFVGALQIRKNIARLVEAFESTPEDWMLVLAGAAGGYGAAGILERIERSRSRARIQMTGYISQAELERLYSRASLFVFPSLDEGFGMPVLEAMAHGVPVITSNRPALAEVAGDAAMLIEPQNTEQLAAALNRLIQDTELRSSLADLGRARAKLYSWERTVRSTYAVYREVAD